MIFRFANLLLAIVFGRRYDNRLIVSNLRAALSVQYCLDLYANFRNASRIDSKIVYSVETLEVAVHTGV